MNIAIFLQLAQLAAQFLQTTHTLSPSPTTTSLSEIANAILRAQNPNATKWLQGALNATLGTTLAVDGTFGSRTEAVLTQFLTRFLTPEEVNTVVAAIKILLSKT